MSRDRTRVRFRLLFSLFLILTARGYSQGRTPVPGGLRALASVAKIRLDTPAEQFAVEFAQSILRHTESATTAKAYINGLHSYFQTMVELRKRMTPASDGWNTTLDVNEYADYVKAKDILKLLGWRAGANLVGTLVAPMIIDVKIEPGSEPGDAERQAFSSYFGVDFPALKAALERKHSFKFHIPSASIPIADDAPFSKEPFLEGLVDDIPVARLYLAFDRILPETRAQLLATIGSDRLIKKYAEVLVLYGSSLSIRNGKLDLPGGASASASWEKLIGVGPIQTGPFLDALLQKDGGKAAAYFHSLSELPLTKQQYFAVAPDRLNTFYAAFPFTEKELIEQHRLFRRDTDFFDLAREVTLDDSGHIHFPGGKGIWTANSSDSEERVLINLLVKKDTERLLTLVRLEKAWHGLLDDAAALILARNYTKYQSLYPYFLSLPPLTAADLTRFFAATAAIDTLAKIDRDSLDTVLAHFHGMISLLVILHQTNGLSAPDSIRILSGYCNELSTAKPANAERASTEITKAALREIGEADPIDVIAGKAETISFESSGRSWSVDRAEWQGNRIRKIIEQQQAGTDLKTSLVALSYAYYSAPDDLILTDDRSFVKHHRFAPEKGEGMWEETKVHNCPTGGLCVSGGLAQLPEAAGNWGRMKIDADLSLRAEGIIDAAVQTQLTAIRSMPWRRMTAESLHDIAEKLRAGREMVRRGDSIQDRLIGKVGTFRLFEITRFLSETKTDAALDLLSASDLYFIATGNQLDDRSYGPCEEYERQLMKEPLWACAGPILLNIADAADREHIPIDAVSLLAEHAVRQMWLQLELRNPTDWLSLVRAMNRLSLIPSLSELEKTWQD